MRDVPAFVLSVILGGIILFFLLWIWFWFEQGGPSRMQSGSQSGYPSDYDQGYSPRYQNNYDNRYGGYGGDSRYAGNGYGYDQGQPAYPPPRYRRRAGCGNPCY